MSSVRVFPVNYYRDPAEVAEENERGSCAGCRNSWTPFIAGERRAVCDLGHKHGKRCIDFDPSIDVGH
jgi:hypothetical protein